MVVAAAAAQVLSAADRRPVHIAEDVVNSAESYAVVDLEHVRPQALDRARCSVRIEVSNQDEDITRLSVRGHDLHQVVRRGLPPASTARVHRQRSMVVHEEENGVRLPVLQPHPLGAAAAVVLRAHVVRHLNRPSRQQGPSACPERHADALSAVDEGRVSALQPWGAENLVRILALLQADDIIGLWFSRAFDELSRTLAATNLEQVPPKEVVGQDLAA